MMKVSENTTLLEILEGGGVIAYPTDTIRGLGCDATNEVAVDKVFAIKQRPKEKSVIVLFSSEEMLQAYGVILSDVQKDFLKNTEKPTTMIVDGLKGLAPSVYHADGSVGVRIVQPKEGHRGSVWCYEFIEAYGKPIVSTSANISGEPSPLVFSEIAEDILAHADAYPPPETATDAGSPSQIVRIDTHGEVVIVRA